MEAGIGGASILSVSAKNGDLQNAADFSNGCGSVPFCLVVGVGPIRLANAPLLMWVMSAGGEFNYEFTAWKRERVLAFVVNKGGIYYTALASQAARNDAKNGFVADLKTKTFVAASTAPTRTEGTAWLPTERVARAWQAMVTEKPFEF